MRFTSNRPASGAVPDGARATGVARNIGCLHRVYRRSGSVAPVVMALCVGLLTAGTLGPLAGVVVGAAAHLSGVPDAWAAGAGLLTAAAILVPTAALACRVWRIERNGLDG